MTTASVETDLRAQSPVEIDTALAEVYGRISQASHQVDQAWSAVEYRANDFLGRRGYREPKYTRSEVQAAIETVTDDSYVAPSEGMEQYHARDLHKAVVAHSIARRTLGEVQTETEPFDDEFERRGGWTRAFLVNNGNGHVHSSMNCSTCFYTTPYVWLPEVSGHDESEIVEKAGERACTVCYPSAPVDVLKRKTQFFTPDEKAAAVKRAEREAKRAAKAAAEIRVEGMIGWTNGGQGVHVFKTTRGLTNKIAEELSSLAIWGESHPSSGEWTHNVQVLRQALADKGIEYDYDKALKNAQKKARG